MLRDALIFLFGSGFCYLMVWAKDYENARECARCGSMLDPRGFCERCNK